MDTKERLYNEKHIDLNVTAEYYDPADQRRPSGPGASGQENNQTP